MAYYLFDQAVTKSNLERYFDNEKASINSFGSTVNQTFEAYVFAQVIKWYRNNGWAVEIISPLLKGRPIFKLKYNTRGAPAKYSYARCTYNGVTCQVRHGLRVNTHSHSHRNSKSANIVCDIVVMSDVDISEYAGDRALSNSHLISFGEVKHMSAYAELIASFIGLVHELRPEKLKRIRLKKWSKGNRIPCFLYVSGMLYKTAHGVLETIVKRKYDIDIYSFDNPMS